jgi:hypothetical protein
MPIGILKVRLDLAAGIYLACFDFDGEKASFFIGLSFVYLSVYEVFLLRLNFERSVVNVLKAVKWFTFRD